MLLLIGLCKVEYGVYAWRLIEEEWSAVECLGYLRLVGQKNFDAGLTAQIYTVLGGSSVLYTMLGGSSVLAIAGAIGCVLRSGKALCVVGL